jgi:peptidoglycan/LPS O-acetylase OafA/YrhL
VGKHVASTSQMLDRATQARSNNFDSLRFCAAVSVLVSHSFPLSFDIATPQPLYIWSTRQTDLGTIAVLVFFVISGYLVTQSFDRSPFVVRFLKARVLRIYPGLFAATFVTAFLLGPAITTLPAYEYFSQSDTAWYVPRNLSLFKLQYHLPGVFQDDPVRGVVNGPLWTLEYEVLMYLGVLALGVARLLRRGAVLAAWLGAMFLSWRWIGAYYVEFGTPFLSGAVLYLWRDRVPLDWRLAAVSAVGLAAALHTGGFRLAFATFGAYLVIFLATAPAVRLPDLARRGDLSYGIYIFAWPTQQTMTHLLGPPLSWYGNIAASLPVVLVLATLSWHLVERPALSLKRSRVPAMAGAARP